MLPVLCIAPRILICLFVIRVWRDPSTGLLLHYFVAASGVVALGVASSRITASVMGALALYAIQGSVVVVFVAAGCHVVVIPQTAVRSLWLVVGRGWLDDLVELFLGGICHAVVALVRRSLPLELLVGIRGHVVELPR